MINKPITLNIQLSYTQAVTLMLQLKDKISMEKREVYNTTPELPPEKKGFKKFKEKHNG